MSEVGGITLETVTKLPSYFYLSSTISRSLLKLMSAELVMPSNHLILGCLLFLLPCPSTPTYKCPILFLFSNVLV